MNWDKADTIYRPRDVGYCLGIGFVCVSNLISLNVGKPLKSLVHEVNFYFLMTEYSNIYFYSRTHVTDIPCNAFTARNK